MKHHVYHYPTRTICILAGLGAGLAQIAAWLSHA